MDRPRRPRSGRAGVAARLRRAGGPLPDPPRPARRGWRPRRRRGPGPGRARRSRALLAGQQPDGGFGVRPYSKWTGAHWRLVSLVELAAPAGEPRLQAAASTVLDWLTGAAHRRTVQVVDGLTRRCASQEGNALAVACRLGHGRRPAGRAAGPVAGRLAVAGRRLELRPAGQRPPLVVPRDAPTGLGPARVLAGHGRDLGAGGGRPRPPSCSCPTGCSARCGTAR